MSKTKKALVIILICAACMLLLFSAALLYLKNYEKQMANITKDDFSIALNVPKAELKSGEKITITSELKNISGKKIMICNDDERVHAIRIYKKGEDEKNSSKLVWVGGFIEPNEKLHKQIDFKPEQPGKYFVKAYADAEVITKGGINGSWGDPGVNSVTFETEAVELTVSK